MQRYAAAGATYLVRPICVDAKGLAVMSRDVVA